MRKYSLEEKYIIANHQGFWGGLNFGGYMYAKFYNSYEEAAQTIKTMDLEVIARFIEIKKVFAKIVENG